MLFTPRTPLIITECVTGETVTESVTIDCLTDAAVVVTDCVTGETVTELFATTYTEALVTCGTTVIFER